MIPFAKTRVERLANSDPRLSLEERYGTHAGYVTAVTKAAANAVRRGFLLDADADALIADADASDVLNRLSKARLSFAKSNTSRLRCSRGRIRIRT